MREGSMSKEKDLLQSQRQASGEVGEQIAESVMRSLGIVLVEKIATPTKYIRGKMVHVGKVSGDRRGILSPNGKSVHAEVKSRKSKNLPFSALENHQRKWLSDHAKHGGLSLLIWISSWDVYVMRWGPEGIPGFTEKGSSITPEVARSLNLDSLDDDR
jgi:hypothetical protein